MSEPKDTQTRMMEKAKLGVVGDPTPIPGGLRAHTRAAWKYVRPAISKTWWWVLLGVAVLMVMWEIDDLWAGTLYSWMNWIRDSVLKRFPIVPFGLGMLVYHYILRAERGGRDG
jgi:hypothetical protein